MILHCQLTMHKPNILFVTKTIMCKNLTKIAILLVFKFVQWPQFYFQNNLVSNNVAAEFL